MTAAPAAGGRGWGGGSAGLATAGSGNGDGDGNGNGAGLAASRVAFNTLAACSGIRRGAPGQSNTPCTTSEIARARSN